MVLKIAIDIIRFQDDWQAYSDEWEMAKIGMINVETANKRKELVVTAVIQFFRFTDSF